jgi:hypothetical protein
MAAQWSKWLIKISNTSQLPQQRNDHNIDAQLVQELVESEVEIRETKVINPETTEAGAVEAESELVDFRKEHESRHLKTTPYKSTEGNIGSFDFNDLTSRPNANDRIRRCLVEHGPGQETDADFRASGSEDKRRFSLDWFSKKILNGELKKQLADLLKNLFSVFAAYYLEKFFEESRCHILPITKEDFQTGNTCIDWKSMKIHPNIKTVTWSGNCWRKDWKLERPWTEI